MHDFLRSCRFYFGYAFFFSMFINILQLTFSIYMLQVYDKVLTSYNLPTLVVITVAAAIALVVLAFLEWIRSRLLIRAGIEFDKKLSMPVLHENLMAASAHVATWNKGTIRDVQMLRNFLGGNAIFAFFDIPWMPIFFALIFILHPALGLTSVLGGALVFLLGVLTQRCTNKQLEQANQINKSSSDLMSTAFRNASAVRAMGMIGAVSQRWNALNTSVIALQTRASRAAGLLHSISKSLRSGLQVLIYAVGAYLVVTHESTAGIMIAASIIMGRALAPIDQAMSTYKQSLEAWGAYKRLKVTMDAPPPSANMELPAPQGDIAAENLVFVVQGRPILKNVNFRLKAGRSLSIIGPSASGKSTLCKMLLSIWPATAGKVRIDGADIATWDSERLGRYLGYLPQDVELFSGTVAENIARMAKTVEPEKVIQAARMARVHDMILELPKGYDTPLGEQGAGLSGGQRQRIGLARALYGEPKLVILDEPNSNLDEEGEACLGQALLELKKLGTTVILVTHKPSILSVVDDVMLLQGGVITLYGSRQEVLAKIAESQRKHMEMRKRQEEARRRQAQLDNLEKGLVQDKAGEGIA